MVALLEWQEDIAFLIPQQILKQWGKKSTIKVMNYICFPAKNLVWTGGHIEKFRLRAADNKIHDLLAQE